MPKNDGKLTERIFDAQFKDETARDINFVYYKFIDSHAARNLVQNQPADRLIIYMGTVILTEIKSSYDPMRFPLKNISKKQIGTGRRWVAAGTKSMFIIHRLQTNEFFFVPLTEVLKKMDSGHKSWKWSELEYFKHEATYAFWKRYGN